MILKLWHAKERAPEKQTLKTREQLSAINQQLRKSVFLTSTNNILNLKDKLELNSRQNNI